MSYIFEGFVKAFKLITTFDGELYEIIARSLMVSLSAVVLSALICVPFGIWIGLKSFKGKIIFSRFLYALMSVPSVVVGLVILLFFSRRGPLGFMELLYTPVVMIIAQTVLISPLILGLIYNTVKRTGPPIEKEGILLGASTTQINFLVMKELRADIMVHLMTGFSRAISEVGTVMIVGGNIKGATRVMTTTITMMNSMGHYEMSIALGLVLLLLSLLVNSLVYREVS